MEIPKIELPKLPDMIMCGDHPSFTKTELNLKEPAAEPEREPREPREPRAPRDKSAPAARLTPTSSRVERQSEARLRVVSEHVLRAGERRRVRELVAPRHDAAPNSALMQAALGSFRWPPYLLAVWVAVLVLTHALHCLAGLLERALPRLRQVTQYFRTWAEETWRSDPPAGNRLYPLALASLTGLLYVLYFGLYALYSVAVWAIEPLCVDVEEKPSSDMMEKITNYVEEIGSKTNTSVK